MMFIKLFTQMRKILKYLLLVAVCIALVFSIYLTIFTFLNSTLWDFSVFNESAQRATSNNNIYTTYGDEKLPYWYFPWLAWFFIPIAIFPRDVAEIIFLGLSLLSMATSIHFLSNVYYPAMPLSFKGLIISSTLIMSWLLFKVGQMDFLILGLTVWMIFLIEKNKGFRAGLLFPVLLFKPHLVLIFIPFVLIRGGKPFFKSALLSTGVLSLLSFLTIPDWPIQMLNMLRQSGQRTDNYWGFTTLPTLLGLQENWSGTANIPLIFAMLIVSFLVVWKYRNLPTIPLLSLALAASLLCAPRAYSYNLPFILPAMLWLSDNDNPWTHVLWISTGVIALVSLFSTRSYIIVIIVFFLSTLKAYLLFKKAPTFETPKTKI